jgi:hypothetical protein
LPTGLVVNGSVEHTEVFNVSVTRDGVTHVEDNSLELGSATDSNGATYRVNYHNHQSAAIPPGGFPFTVLENDHFNLVGNGQASQMQVRFVIRVTFTSDIAPPTVQVVNEKGDAFDCDVICDKLLGVEGWKGVAWAFLACRGLLSSPRLAGGAGHGGW